MPVAVPTEEATTDSSDPTMQVFRLSAPALLPAGRLLKLPIFVFGVRRPVEKVTVSLQLRHETGGWLGLALAAPDGTVVALSMIAGTTRGLGDGPTGPLVFDDDAERGIADSREPYVGPHRPQQPLAVLRHPGRRLNGVWHLVLSDSGANRARTLVADAALTFRS
jgi:hypothetical protein